MTNSEPAPYLTWPRGHGRSRALLTHEAFELSRAGLSVDDFIAGAVAAANPDEISAAGLVIAEPTWFPAEDASPEEARRWLDEFSGWALADDEDEDLEGDDY